MRGPLVDAEAELEHTRVAGMVSTRGATRLSKDELMQISFAERELRLILTWRQQGAFFPDEDRVLRKLHHALDTGAPAQLSRLQVQIVYGWAEEELSAAYGGGEVTNPEEGAVLGKLRTALGYD